MLQRKVPFWGHLPLNLSQDLFELRSEFGSTEHLHIAQA